MTGDLPVAGSWKRLGKLHEKTGHTTLGAERQSLGSCAPARTRLPSVLRARQRSRKLAAGQLTATNRAVGSLLSASPRKHGLSLALNFHSSPQSPWYVYLSLCELPAPRLVPQPPGTDCNHSYYLPEPQNYTELRRFRQLGLDQAPISSTVPH